MDRDYQLSPSKWPILDFAEKMTDRFLLWVYWYFVYRDFGTTWVCCRQLGGHEYIDAGELVEMFFDGRLLVLVGTKDLICPGRAIFDYLEKKITDYSGEEQTTPEEDFIVPRVPEQNGASEQKGVQPSKLLRKRSRLIERNVIMNKDHHGGFMFRLDCMHRMNQFLNEAR